nr:NADH dehydrogenase subunit 2 [Typhlocyba bilaminata]
MKLNLSKMLFFNTMILGIIMSISSSNWILIWCGLEISLVSFIPLMISNKKMSSEATMKYFIIQSISSAMLMLGMLIMIMKGDYNYDYILTTAILIKMGVVPFHNWVLTVAEGMEMVTMMILLTINKIAPLVIMTYLKTSFNVIVMMTVLAGSILSLNQNSIKKMIAYSSIFNMGFILSVIKLNMLWMLYLMFYSMMMFMLMNILTINNSNFVNQMTMSETIINKMSIWMMLLSLGGMPPMIGFYTKYLVMTFMVEMKMILLLMIMVMSSLMIMFMYLRMTFMSIMVYSSQTKIKLFNLNEMSYWTITLNLLLLPILFLTKTI